MKISIAVSYPNGAVATICIPLAENAKVSVSTLPKQEGGLETAKESQQSAGRVWSRESAVIAKSIDELNVFLAAGEKEEGEGKGRIGGVGERKERGVEEEKPDHAWDLSKMSFDAQGGQYFPPHKMVRDFIAAYGFEVVSREFLNAQAWLVANPKKRKTLQGTGRFLNAWISRAQRPMHFANYKEATKPPTTGSLLEGLNDSQEGW